MGEDDARAYWDNGHMLPWGWVEHWIGTQMQRTYASGPYKSPEMVTPKVKASRRAANKRARNARKKNR